MSNKEYIHISSQALNTGMETQIIERISMLELGLAVKSMVLLSKTCVLRGNLWFRLVRFGFLVKHMVLPSISYRFF